MYSKRIQIDIDAMLEDCLCDYCKCVGLLSNGSFDFICPNCGEEGALIPELDESYDPDED